MDYDELKKIWNSVLLKLGYLESRPGYWVAETKELTIILRLKLDARKKEMYMDIGVLFKKIHNYTSIQELNYEDYDIGQGLWTLLAYMGEWEYYLNNLFCYATDINSNDEVKNNITELGMLFLTKVNPHIEELHYFASMAKDFEKVETWYPFINYFRPNEDHNNHFSGSLQQYHQHYHSREKKDRF